MGWDTQKIFCTLFSTFVVVDVCGKRLAETPRTYFGLAVFLCFPDTIKAVVLVFVKYEWGRMDGKQSVIGYLISSEYIGQTCRSACVTYLHIDMMSPGWITSVAEVRT